MKAFSCSKQQGFTLVEAIMVIVITGIIATAAAVFIRDPVNAYVDTVRRAALADIADTAARRVARELSSALPNSVRVDSTGNFLEFVPIVAAGRYRTDVGSSSSGNPLLFNGSDTSFDVLGPPIPISSDPSLSFVIFNQGIPGADVYENSSSVRRLGITVNTPNELSFSGSGFSTPSPGSRFQIVRGPVSYACDLSSGMLWRYTGYDFQPTRPSSLSGLDGLSNVSRALLASRLSGCKFTYEGALQSKALVSIQLSFTRSGESVRLQQQVSVDNVP